MDKNNFVPFSLRRSRRISLLCLSAFLFFSSPLFSQDFGKLFTSPEEREYLDSLREKFLQRSELEGFNIGEETKPWLEEVTAPEQNFEFQMAGVMNRKNGGKAVWLNGDSVNEHDLPKNVELIEINGQQMLRIKTNNKTHYVKTGQTLNIETGQIIESFEKNAEKPANSIAESIKNALQSGDNKEDSDSDKESQSETVGINDLIEALQVIREAKNVN